MSKSKTLVQIPVGYVCISAHEYGSMRNGLCLNTSQIDDLREQNDELLKHITEQAVKLATSEAKVADLEKEVNEKQDCVLYWFQKYTDLADKLNAVKPDAEAEKT
jgi:predicted nuclease with TOPRIM domain